MLQYDVEGKQKDAGLLTSVLADVGCGAPDGLASGVGRRRVLRRGTEVNSSDCCLPWSVLKAGKQSAGEVQIRKAGLPQSLSQLDPVPRNPFISQLLVGSCDRLHACGNPSSLLTTHRPPCQAKATHNQTRK